MAVDALFAGVICGHILAIISAPLIARALLLVQPEAADGGGLRLPSILTGLSPMMLAVPVFVFGLVLWSIAGLLFGVLFIAVHRGHIMSLPVTPDVFYTAVVLFLVSEFTALVSLLVRGAYRIIGAVASLALLLFGWVLPNVALLNR